MIFLFNCRWKLPLESVKINVCYFKANMHHFPHNFIFASDDQSQDIWGLSEYEYPGMVKVILLTNSYYSCFSNIIILRKIILRGKYKLIIT